MAKRKLRMGMVGGGRDAFIGSVHRMAANLDGQVTFTAGALSSSPEKARLSGEDLFLDPKRIYTSYKDMAAQEAALPATERIDFVSIVTPNNTHFEAARTFLEAGFHVICDKPMTFTLEEAKKLQAIVKKSGKVFVLTHNYTGYPMVKEARHMVRAGKLGKILKIVAEYPQGWLIHSIEKEGSKQAAWRTDPKRAGISCCMGDIGTHAENLARYITGLEIKELCADLTSFGKSRTLDDDGNILVHYKNGARGIIYASQISAGEENGLAIRVYGEKLSLEWHQEYPNDLIVKDPKGPRRVHRRGNDYNSPVAKKFTRIPFGHPEAFIEAFANIYLEGIRAIRDAQEKKKKGDYDFPTVEDGVYGMAFIENVVKSGKSAQKWVPFKV